MNDGERTTTSARGSVRLKHMRTLVCAVCGEHFQGGPRAMLCPRCSAIYQRHYQRLYKQRKPKTIEERDKIRAEALALVCSEPRENPAPAARENALDVRESAPGVREKAPATRCGYCGRELGPKAGQRGYCWQCIAHGFHWLHEVTGRTAKGVT